MFDISLYNIYNCMFYISYFSTKDDIYNIKILTKIKLFLYVKDSGRGKCVDNK